MVADAPKHMSAEEFRRAGHAVIDWLAEYYERVESFPVHPGVRPGDIRELLPVAPPPQGESFDAIMEDLERVVIPGLMHWQSPNFFGYFPANTSPPSVLGDLVSSGLGVQGMLWQTSPACTEIETHVLDWLIEMLGLPGKFKSTSQRGGGVIQDTASSATLCALLAARERASVFTARERGTPVDLIAYCSEETHSSMEKAMSISGLGHENLRKIATNAELAMDPAVLVQTIAGDREAGFRPFFVCATVGTTSSLAIDPVAEIGAICTDQDLWLHVDAAMAGTAALCPEYRYIHSGVELADSYCFNPHKWMLTNFDCDCFYVADREPLIRALTVMPEYLRNEVSERGDAIDYRDWHIPLGRRFRVMKLWFVIRSYGVIGLQDFVRHHIGLAERFEQWIADDPEYELAVPRSLNLVCFRRHGSDDDNQSLLRRLNESGRMFLTHTVINGRYCLRFCIGQTYTEQRHVEQAWQLIRES